MTLVLDAGALLALERRDRELWARVKRSWLAGEPALTHGGIVGQVWRGGSGRQAPLARAMPTIDVVPLDDDLGRRAGVLLALTRGRDVIDAAVVLLCRDGDDIVTSDPDDIATLAAAAGIHVDVVAV